MSYAAAPLVPGQPRQGFPYGLFSVLSPRSDESGHWQNGIRWEALTCQPASGRSGAECSDEEAIGLPKQLDRDPGEHGAAASFAVYGHYTCTPGGHTPEEAQELANQHLLAREEAFVEGALWDGRLGNTPNLADDAADLTSGTAVASAAALARIEDWIAQNYGSLGMIHATRGAVLVLSQQGLVVVRGSRLETLVGTPVVAGAGYPNTSPTGTTPTTGDYWVYGSPPIFGYRSEVFTSSNRVGDLLNRGTNDLTSIAERSYSLGYDPCGTAAALFTSASTGGGGGGGGDFDGGSP